MWKMSSQLETIVAAYKTLTKIPSLTGGKLNNAANKVTAKWSVRNLDKGKNTSYATSYTLDSELYVTDESDFGTDISNEILSAISPRENYKAIIREEKNGKDAKKQYLEVWNTNTLSQSVDLTALDIHGDVYADSEFGSLDWSPDEKALVYVAEKKLPKFEPYIKRKAEEKPKLDGSGETAPRKGEEFLYRQDWGEQLVGKHLSVVVVFKLATETFTVLSGIPDGMCPGQVRFSPDGNSVVGVVWETEPRRLGLIFCTNRPSYIFECTLDGAFRKLSGDGLAVRSPRLSPAGDLVWLQREAGGPHHACHQLVIMKKNTNTITTLIDIIDTEVKTENGYSFTGLYCQSLPHKCFSADGKRLVLSTQHHAEIRAYVLHIESGSITDISNNRGSPYSTSVVDVRSDVILVTCSSLVTPGQLYIARLPAVGSEAATSWSRVTCNCDATAPVAAARVRYLQLQHANSTDSVNSFSAIYMAPNIENKQFPLIVWPHGGPHSNFVNAYSLEAALFTTLGFALARINYRGSIGQGEANVRSLLGHIGDYDVKDCLLTLTTLLERDERLCPKNIFLNGGSYGGLIVAHLAGLYPDRFNAVVMRNPLIDLASKANYADNYDGCAAESGFDFTEKGPVSEEQLLAMRRCSPIAHVHKVKAPTALMLGSGDKRVPHFQGLEYARRLKANGVPTRIYMYDDNHSLSSPAAEMDNLINGAHWFMEHLQL
ncbi:acylamino-acid-releasing enzyme-like isoform X1 [Helicoverpa zea]|uniref:acylamino-acid-releasing enzyme-like isoform X1 n=1 Tax=Helicoverpa zea TaxID=7113 RepID=UPI001F5919CE|nr:acylamino-acid-releasing enzyme-like isoform X1 [Helicoverpa zea]